MEDIKVASVFVIRDLETLRVIADPLRAQIVEVLAMEPLTVKQVADRLGLASSKLYYHVKLLEEHGLIRVADTRMVSGIVEKQYRATAGHVAVDDSLLTFATDQGKQNLYTILASTVDTTRADILRSVEARLFELEQGGEQQPRRVLLSRDVSRIPEARAEEFHQRLATLIHEFNDADEPGPAGRAHQPYALTVAFYPSFYYPQTQEGE
jgi:DNA-binding transcriptional ArsR family regulator